MKKIFSIVVSALFLILQNSAPLLAASTASNWAQLYNNLYTNKENSTLTTDITKAAGDSTIPITGSVSLTINGNYNISAASGTLFDVLGTNYLILATGASISGAIVNNGTLFTTDLSSLSGGISGTGSLYNTDSSLTTYNTITQDYIINSGTLTNNGTYSVYRISNTTSGATLYNYGAVNATEINNIGYITNSGTITATYLYNGNSITSEADDISAAITNNGTLNFTGGANANTISGNGTTYFNNDSVNNAYIDQSIVYNTGFLDNNAEISSGDFNNNSGATLNNNALISASSRIANLGTINTNANLLSGLIRNDGVVNFDGGTNRNIILNAAGNTSSGVINFMGNTTNNATIVQNTVTNSGHLTNNAAITAANVSNTSLLANNSTITGSLHNTGVITSTGTLSLSGISSNSGTIEQAALSNSGAFSNNGEVDLSGSLVNSGTLTSKADSIVTGSGIANSGTLNFIGGANGNAITGSGTTYFYDNSVNNASVSQSTINNQGTLENNASLIANTFSNSGTFNNKSSLTAASASNSGVINSATTNLSIISFTNNGTLNLTGAGTFGSSGDTITGAGTVNFNGVGVDITNNTVISQSNINNIGVLENNAALFAAAVLNNSGVLNNNSTINAAAIKNDGTINSTDAINAYQIENNGEINIEAENLDSASIINNGSLFLSGTGNFGAYGNTLNGNGSLFFNSDTTNIINNTNINQANVINYNQLENNNVIEAAYLENIGILENNGLIEASVLINSGTLFSNKEGLLSPYISNTGTITLYGSGAFGANGNTVVGNGNLFFDDSYAYVTNNTVITQTNLRNLGHFTNNALVSASTIYNYGTIENNAYITVSTLTNSGVFNSSVDDISANAIINSGEITLTGDGSFGESGNTVTGSIGVLNFDGEDITNNTAITQSIIRNFGTLENKALLSAVNIVNDGTMSSAVTNLAFNLMTNNGELELTNSGNLGSSGDVLSGGGNLTIALGGVVINNSRITQETITNNGYLETNASNLTGNIINNAALVYTGGTQSSGSSLSGAGNVFIDGDTTFQGNNTYTGPTYLTGLLSIANNFNIGTGDVVFNGGVLQITDDTSLTNKFATMSNNNVQIDNDGDVSLTGKIESINNLVKSGDGVLTLAMASNSYEDTYVQEGTLAGYTTNINGTVDILIGATAEFKDTQANTLNEITGMGTVVKSGDSLTTITNDVTANIFNVSTGTIAVNTSNFNVSTTNIASSATLAGNGLITGDVNVIGTLAAGNSVDTLTIDGDLDLASGSVTEVELTNTPADASDKTVVSGNATINSGALLAVENTGTDRFFEWKTFDILESSGTLSGTYTYDGSISGYDSSRIGGELTYDYTNGVITLLAKRNATDYVNTVSGKSHNQTQAAQVVDNLTATSLTGDITNPLLQLEALAGFTPSGITPVAGSTINSALADMDGVLYANTALTSLFNAKSAHIYDRIASREAAPAKACPSCFDNVWAQYYSQYNKVYADANSPRFTNNVTGVMAGYDRYSADNNFLLGAFAGGSKTDLRQNSDTMDINDLTVGAYGGYLGEDWTFKGVLYLGYQDFDGNRHITFMDRDAKASYYGHNIALDLEAAYNLFAFDGIKIKPFVGILNAYSHQQHFNETGADSLNLNVDSNNAYNVQARLGAQAEGKYRKLNWYANMAIKQFIGNDYQRIKASLSLPNTNMDIISAKLGGTYFSGGAGVNYALTNALSVFGNGEAGVGSKSANCYGNIGLAYTW